MAVNPRDILCVDDDPTVLELVCEAVEMVGHASRRATNGQQALDEIGAKRPDLVIMDVEMPVMDGLEAVRRIRANPATQTLPVIQLTGRDSDADIVRGVGAGATMYLTKPVDVAGLTRLLTAMLK